MYCLRAGALGYLGAAGEAVGNDGATVLADAGEEFALAKLHGHFCVSGLETPVAGEAAAAGFDLRFVVAEGLQDEGGLLWVTKRLLMAVDLRQRAPGLGG